MDIALLVARLLLAGVFAVAGVAKLIDPTGSREALVGFGVPRVLSVPFGILLPLAEIAVAIALIPTGSAVWGGIGALTLLLLFVLGIAVSMARGTAPDCHCFGQLHSEPAGWSSLIRNVVLSAIAGGLIWQGWDDAGTSAVAWIGDLRGAEQVGLAAGIVMAVAIGVQGWLLLHALGQNGRLLYRLEALEAILGSGGDEDEAEDTAAEPERGLAIGALAPAFSLSGLYGEVLTLDALRSAGRPVLLVFSDPNCGPCNAMLPDLASWQRDHGAMMTFALISRGPVEANREKAAKHGLAPVLLQANREVAEAFNAPATPSAVIVRPDGTVGSALAEGAPAIRALVSRSASGQLAATNGSAARTDLPMAPGTPAAPAAPIAPGTAVQAARAQERQPNRAADRPDKTGQAAPSLTLPDLNGNQISLEGYRGRDTLVLFWNPGCGFCRRMLDDLKAWEANPPAGAPQLLVVSTGEVGANRELGLRSTVVLDQGFSAGRSFGATGTPSAVLVNANGLIASPVGVGADNVLALANGREIAPPEPPSNGNGGGQAALGRMAARMGDAAPAVSLRDLKGETVELASLRGQKTMLLFWNPGCGFCRRMADDLRAWEDGPPKGAPKLLLVSTGTVEANESLGLRSTILLDDGFATGRAFGATGTPSAVLIDHKGKIASPVAVGAEAVLELAGAPRKSASL